MQWLKVVGLALMPSLVLTYAPTDSIQDAVRFCKYAKRRFS
jgi:hypothetical protein